MQRLDCMRGFMHKLLKSLIALEDCTKVHHPAKSLRGLPSVSLALNLPFTSPDAISWRVSILAVRLAA